MAVFQLDHVRMNVLRCWKKKSKKLILMTAMYILPLIQKSYQVFVERLNRPSGALSKKVPPPHNKIVFAKVFAHERFELLFVGVRENRVKNSRRIS